jgi:histidine kinase
LNLEKSPVMNLHDVIFSGNPIARLYRHTAFWSSRLFFLLVSAKIGGYLLSDHPSDPFPLLMGRNVTSMAWEMIFTYGMAYYFLPRLLLRRKYVTFGLILLAFTGIVLVGMAETDHYFNPGESGADLSLLSLWGMFWGYAGYGPLAVCGFFLVIKILKNHDHKMEEKSTLLRENEDSELQILKAQIHPHFLFNTLNNIYSFALSQSPIAAGLAGNLSGTMRYMITDCEADLVPLAKELKMLRDYIELEKVRYGERLSMKLEIEGGGDHKLIAPLLMIPFIENCFKHGSSQLLGPCWIKMHIFINEDALHLELSNNKPSQAVLPADQKRIGLRNVRKRLELLYPGNHSLQINPGTDTYCVSMRVPLHTETTESPVHAEY